MLLLHRDVRVTPMECNEQQGTGIENGSNGAVNFDQTGQTEKSGPPWKEDPLFRLDRADPFSLRFPEI